jgi:tRNA (mo5U34)-methyltransferase
MTYEEKLTQANAVPFWFHSIDLGSGVVTNGHKPLQQLEAELKTMNLPNLRGKSVLDIGAWDGFFSFKAEEMGAARVLALDHYVWSMNLALQQQYYRECKEKNIVPKPYHLIPGHWNPSTLPGKAGFDTAHRIKRSSVEQMVGDFMTIDPVEVGMFDVVYFLGVLYHLEDPFGGLKRLSMFARELAVIETAGVYLKTAEDRALFEFYGANELAGDVGNWFAPNLKGLMDACKAVGFTSVKVMNPHPPILPEHHQPNEMVRCRLTVHASKG